MAVSWIVCAGFFIASTVIAETCNELNNNNVTLITSQIGNILGSTTLQTTAGNVISSIASCNQGASTLDILPALASVFGAATTSANSTTLVTTIATALRSAIAAGCGLNQTNMIDIGDVMSIYNTVSGYNISALTVDTSQSILASNTAFTNFGNSVNSSLSGATTGSLTYNPTTATLAQKSACLSDYQGRLSAIQSQLSTVSGELSTMGNNVNTYATDVTSVNNTMNGAQTSASSINTPGTAATTTMNNFITDANTKVSVKQSCVLANHITIINTCLVQRNCFACVK